MRSLSEMCKPANVSAALLAVVISVPGISQINSPFSRYGLGDLYNSRNVASKAMGGLATPYADIQSINFINPASYSRLQAVTFDVGMEAEFRTLVNQAKTDRYQSGNVLFNYAVIGVPLLKDKKGITRWGAAGGLRPVSRMSYDVISDGRINGIDSTNTEYRGTGGAYRAFLGTGFKVGGLSLGINAGFLFGQQDINTFRTLINDSVFYYQANFQNKTSFNRFSLDGGLQYEIKTSKNTLVRLGANGFMGGDSKAERNILRQTFFFNSFGGPDSVDVVERRTEFGNITMPTGYTVGLLFENTNKFLVGAEYEQVKWSDFRNFGQSDNLGNTTMLRVGAQLLPDAQGASSYFKQVAYRAGYFSGKDYVVANGAQLPVWGITLGAGLPVRRYNMYSNQFTTINTSFEIGRRGGSESPYFERYYRINIGLSLSDLWFIKTRYD